MNKPWQDKVMGIAIIMFVYSLLPQIIFNFQHRAVFISWQTLVLTSVGLYTFSFCMWTMGLKLSSIANFLTAFGWSIMIIQKIFYS